MVLNYETFVPWNKDPIRPVPSSVIPKKVSLKDEKLIESEDKENCEIVDYTFVGVLKKKDAGGQKDNLEEKFWKDYIKFDK